MPTISYDTLNNLGEFSFIAGSDQVLNFTVYKENGLDLLDLGGGPVYWKLCPWGSAGIETLSKSGNITGTGKFEVTLTAAETLALRGKYIHQILMTDNDGNTFRPAQGTVLILPAINAI